MPTWTEFDTFMGTDGDLINARPTESDPGITWTAISGTPVIENNAAKLAGSTGIRVGEITYPDPLRQHELVVTSPNEEAWSTEVFTSIGGPTNTYALATFTPIAASWLIVVSGSIVVNGMYTDTYADAGVPGWGPAEQRTLRTSLDIDTGEAIAYLDGVAISTITVPEANRAALDLTFYRVDQESSYQDEFSNYYFGSGLPSFIDSWNGGTPPAEEPEPAGYDGWVLG